MVNLVSHINFISSVAGFILGFALLFRQKNPATVVFALAILIMAYFRFMSFSVINITPWLSQVASFLMRYARNIGLLLPPLLWFYTRQVTGFHSAYRYRDLWHLTPFVIFMFFIDIPGGFHNHGQLLFLPSEEVFSGLFQITGIRSLWVMTVLTQETLYSGFSLVFFRRFVRSVNAKYSSINKLKIRMVSVFLGLFFLNTLIRNVGFWSHFSRIASIDFYFFTRSTGDLLLDLIIIYIIFMAFYEPRVMEDLILEVPKPDGNEDDAEKSSSKYKKLSLDADYIDYTQKKLMRYLEEEQPYLSINLTIGDISKVLNIPVHHLSYTINSRLNQNFYSFINTRRVEYAKKLIAEHAASNRDDKLLNIALDSGFNSKTTFNTYFKKVTGFTPSQYRSQLKAGMN